MVVKIAHELVCLIVERLGTMNIIQSEMEIDKIVDIHYILQMGSL